jgi:hypothetical protein
MDAQEPHAKMDAEATEILPRLDESWQPDQPWQQQDQFWRQDFWRHHVPSQPDEPSRQGSWRADIIDTLCIMAALVVLMFMLADQTGALRTFAAFCFAFFVPGRAIVTNWPRLAEWSDIGMSVVLSVALVTFVSMVTLWLKYWHPIGQFQVEAVLSVVAVGVAIARRNGVVVPIPGRRSATGG